jgi:poly(3-hydroxybutyrate) depolymerase
MDWDFLSANAPGLDYLYNHPHVDRNRIGVTGLSGGGWQTIVLSVDFSESPVAAGAVEKWESRGVCRISKGGCSPGRHLASTSGPDGGIAPYHLIQPSMGNVLPPQSPL